MHLLKETTPKGPEEEGAQNLVQRTVGIMRRLVQYTEYQRPMKKCLIPLKPPP